MEEAQGCTQEDIPEVISNKFYRLMDSKYFVLVKCDKKGSGEVYSLQAKCLPCPTENLIKGDSTTVCNFTKHLKACHKPQHTEYVNAKTAKRIKVDQSQSNLNMYVTGVTPAKKLLVDRLTVQYIVYDMLPLSTVESSNFRNLIRGAAGDQTLQIMDRKTLKNRITVLYNDTKLLLKNQLGAVKHTCLTADIWSSHAKSYLGVTGHWLGEDYRRNSVSLACRRFTGTHSFDRIAQLLIEIMSNFGITKDKVVSIVTDNGSNFVKAFKEYGTEYGDGNSDIEMYVDSDDNDNDEVMESQSAPEMYSPENDELEESWPEDLLASSSHSNEETTAQDEPCLYDILSSRNGTVDGLVLPPHFRCAAHTLNLIASSDSIKMLAKNHKQLKTFHDKVMTKCNNIWKMSSYPKQAEVILKICGKQFKKPVVTRWNSVYDSVVTLLSVRETLGELSDRLGKARLTPNELLYLDEYSEIFSPISKALDKLQGENEVFMGNVLPVLLRMKAILVGLRENLKLSKNLLDVILEAIENRFGDILSLDKEEPNLLAVASISHPYFKLLWISDPEIKENYRKAFIRKCYRFATPDLYKSIVEESTKEQDGFFDFAIGHEDVQMTDGILEKTVELECVRYFQDSRRSVACLKEYPTIEKTFAKFNTGLPSSAPVEREFSYAGLILTKKRSLLCDEMFEMLIFLKCNKIFHS